MELSWRFCVHLMEELWNLCGSFMEKILDWNVEKLWSICEKPTRWKIAEKPKTRYNGVVHEPNGRIENATEDYELGN